MLALVTHPACLDHRPGPGHPEHPERLRAVLEAIDAADLPGLRRETAPRATSDQIAAAHDPAYVARLLDLQIAQHESLALDADTMLSAGSVEAALRAAGAAIHAVDLVMAGQAKAAFAAVRPPGHHAEPGRAMGFCLFNNVAIAAHHARRRWGVKRIAIVDFDVHHGNGTQAAFWDDPDLLFASSHQSPCYPGTGAAHECGAAKTIHNAPLPPGADSAMFRRAWTRELLPAIDTFAPELLILSAGFDAHRADPLAQLELDTDDFAWLTAELAAIAYRHAQGRVVSLLEGGYDLDALAQSTLAHLRALSAGAL